MNLKKILHGEEVESIIEKLINKIHQNGGSDLSILEQIAYLKLFHGKILDKYENTIITTLGLFYKSLSPNSIIEETYSIFADTIREDTGKDFTPVQASAYREINQNRYFSFSAPTSSGKSFLFRELISSCKNDIVIVVPSRALISEYYYEVLKIVDKKTLVLQFVEIVNTKKSPRRIFIITPERGKDLFKFVEQLNIELFLLDESQISEELIRGMRFDSLVRRVDRVFPDAKKVFAHPFVNNPEAQLIKHNFTNETSSRCYNQNSVGKIFLEHDSGHFSFFSPFQSIDHLCSANNIAKEVIRKGGTMLVYTSKSKIYDGRFETEFGEYLNELEEIDNPRGIELINSLKEFIGANQDLPRKHSVLISMMKKGVVVHHGSMPLKARLIIENFIKLNLAKICFATSTLNQGINMPFDVVWIDHFYSMTPLVLKNLIGRSGRSTLKKAHFDYGFTIVKKQNVNTFKKRMRENVTIDEISNLERSHETSGEDFIDLIEGTKNDTIDPKSNLSEEQLDRIEQVLNQSDSINFLLDNLISGREPITASEYYKIPKSRRTKIKEEFRNIYVSHLRRKELTDAEKNVLNTAIPILLWKIQGKSFSEIVSLRVAYLSQEGTDPEKSRKSKISKIKYSQIPSSLPDKTLKKAPLFPFGTLVSKLDYDTVVYDTYDYLDKVISFSLSDPICAALSIHNSKTNDPRADILSNFIRFGTNNDREIWLLKYGFSFEEIEVILPHVKKVNRSRIRFKRSARKLDEHHKQIISRYL